MKIIFDHKFEEIINIDNLFLAWQEFIKGKRNKKDIQEFSFYLLYNILSLHEDLKNHTYKHGGYKEFKINDPKPRIIHKASVRDRLLHHAVYRVLYQFFDKKFVSESYSCRNGKGTHKAVKRFKEFVHKVSKNNTKQCWILKCDIRKFFASVDQDILLAILEKYVDDKEIINLLREIIFSFNYGGLPLGNLTSQLFANVYLNEFDQFIKRKLKARYYIRYCDDFVMFSQDKIYLENLIPQIQNFLQNVLGLTLHPDKVFIKTIYSGVDYLGWINFKDHRILRKTTEERMLKRIKENPKPEVINSYLGLLKWGNTYKIKI